MKIMKKTALIISSLLVLIACSRKIDEFKPDKGSADFTKFVAVGNSLMAGYSDGALYHSGQIYSIPNILAGQFRTVGCGPFVQPMVTSEFGLLPGKMKLGYATDCKGVVSLAPVPDIGTLDPLTPVGYAVNNFGIPGAKSFHFLVAGYGQMNPYYGRFAAAINNSVVTDIVAAKATFFTLWLGDNDVLTYALSGGAADSITGVSLFTFSVESVIQALMANGAKGCIATIPDITSIPFFTTVPYNGLKLTQGQADSVNLAMSLYHLPFHFSAGYNPFFIADPSVPGLHFRQAHPSDMILLTVPQDSLKCNGMGIINPATFQIYPIPGYYVLDSTEIAAIRTATDNYNQEIANLAVKYDLAIVDMHAKLQNAATGMSWDGIHFSTQFVTGGLFSTDGVHLTQRGCAVAANYFIEAINAKYSSNIPQADITSFKGLIFP